MDQEFPEDCSPFKIQQLLQDLTEPEILAGKLAPAQEVCTFGSFLSLRELVSLRFLLFTTKKTNTFTRSSLCINGALFAMIGAVCVGPGAAGMPLLETWGSAVHVLSHPSSEKTVDKEKQGHVP